MKNMYGLSKEQMNEVYKHVRLHEAMDSLRESLENGGFEEICEEPLREAAEQYLMKLDFSDSVEFIREEILRDYFDWGF